MMEGLDSMVDNKMDKMIYDIALEAYLEKNNCPVKADDMNKLFPREWFTNNDYHLKSEILNEAIDKGIDVTETVLYKEQMIL